MPKNSHGLVPIKVMILKMTFLKVVVKTPLLNYKKQLLQKYKNLYTNNHVKSIIIVIM